MVDYILLNLVFLLISMFMYMLYIVFINVIGEKGKEIFFDLSIVTSVYLISKYSVYFDYSIDIIKVLLLISLLKNKKVLSILISSYLIISLGFDYKLLTLLYIIHLILQLLIIKDLKKIYRVGIFVVIEIIFGIIFKLPILYTIITNVCFGIFSYIFTYLVEKGEDIINIYGTIKDVEYEKSLRESLFKITHEIKNPIAVCKGYLDMLDVNNSNQVNKYIPIVKQEIERTLTLMNDFLNLTKLKVNKSTMDINLLLEELDDSIKALLIGKNIKFNLNTIDDEIYIEGDYDRLKQVFINIVKNSIESIDENILGLININVSIKKENLLISIKDNGVGMPKEVLNHLGEPFFTTKQKGTGLGVKLSMEIINEHNGSIKYYSSQKKGTEVKILLPLN